VLVKTVVGGVTTTSFSCWLIIPTSTS
jgi:hypothetical protein